jgi:hypothetical protein
MSDKVTSTHQGQGRSPHHLDQRDDWVEVTTASIKQTHFVIFFTACPIAG